MKQLFNIEKFPKTIKFSKDLANSQKFLLESEMECPENYFEWDKRTERWFLIVKDKERIKPI